MTTKWTAADVPDQSGRVAVVTGANTGIGYEAALVLAGRGAKVVIAVRNLDKGTKAVSALKQVHPGADVTVAELDLSSLASVRAAAEALKSALPRIDLLINNAGVMYPPKQTTADGFELQFGTNHLGHFAFTGLLLDNLLDVPGSRVVTVASMAHRNLADIHFDDLQWERKYNRVAAYGQSKLANLMFTYELQRRLAAKGAPTIAVAAHPGISN
ncbi:short-chain dehydrogenase, partial [Mycobacterium sp. ITM-2017-0098]